MVQSKIEIDISGALKKIIITRDIGNIYTVQLEEETTGVYKAIYDFEDRVFEEYLNIKSPVSVFVYKDN